MPHVISDNDWPVFRQLMQDYKAGRLKPMTMPKEQQRVIPREAAVVCLMEGMEHGQTIQAERLILEPHLEVYDVMILGFPQDTGTPIKLKLSDGEKSYETPDIPIGSNRQQFASYLSASAGWREVVRSVTIGNQANYTIMRWRIALAPREDGEPWDIRFVSDVPSFVHPQGLDVILGDKTAAVIQRTQYIGSGLLMSVHAPIPTSRDWLAAAGPPIRAGAIGMVLPVAGGWALTSVEARKFTSRFSMAGPGYYYG